MGQYLDFAKQYLKKRQGIQRPQPAGALPEIPREIRNAVPGLTGYDVGASGVKYRYGETPIQKIQRELIVEPQKKRAVKLSERKLQTEENFRKVVGQFASLIAQNKAKLLQQGGKGGLLPGLKGKVRVLLKDPTASAIAAFPGQVTETTLAMNPVLTGQNRVIKGITERISLTLPDEFDPGTYTAQKTSQSLKNAYRLTKAVSDIGLTPEMFEGMSEKEKLELGRAIGERASGLLLSPEEDAYIEQIIQEVLNTPPAKIGELPGFESKSYGEEALTPEESSIVQRLLSGQ